MDKKKDISVLFKSHPEIVFTDFSFDKKRNVITKLRFFLAAESGFEPEQSESESLVLPLHNSAI